MDLQFLIVQFQPIPRGVLLSVMLVFLYTSVFSYMKKIREEKIGCIAQGVDCCFLDFP